MDEEINIKLDSLVTKFSLINFSEKLKSSCDKLNSALNNLYYSLGSSWYSTKAVDFSSEFGGMVDEVEKNLKDYYRKNVNGVCNDFNILASKYNKRKLEFDGTLDLKLNYPLLLAKGPDGSIGMNINKVKSTLSEFAIEIDEVIDSFSEIPSYVILSKNADGVKNNYNTNSETLKATIKEMASKIVDRVTTFVNQEVDNINKASMLAVEELNNN